MYSPATIGWDFAQQYLLNSQYSLIDCIDFVLQSSQNWLVIWILLSSGWSLITLTCYYFYEHRAIPLHPTYTASTDVTIVVATIDTDENFRYAIRSWTEGNPKAILIVTTKASFKALQVMALEIDPDETLIRVMKVSRANKRVQLAAGIAEVRTRLFVTADDDVFWPPRLLPCLLACFENSRLGGATVAGSVTALSGPLTIWETLGDMRMTALAVVRCASSTVDGGITALSGRTSAYRTEIFKEPGLLDAFVNERWLNKYQVSSADGCALTDSIVKRGWETYIQDCSDTAILTTVKNDWTWLLQVVRWSRDHWRQNIKALIFDPAQTWQHPFTAMGRVRDSLQPFSTLVKCTLITLIFFNRYIQCSATSITSETIYIIAVSMAAQAPQILTLLPHFLKKPAHAIYLPAWVAFCYFRGFISLYALFTLQVTAWGTRKVV